MIRWEEQANPEEEIWLLTPEELKLVQPGTRLWCIAGGSMKYDPEFPPDMDTRYGHIAWGVKGRPVLEWQI